MMTLSVASAAGVVPALAQDTDVPVYRRASVPLDARADDLLARMTLDEKIALLAGASSMTTNGVPRLGVHGIKMTDGPTGVRSPEGKPATVFPVGAAIAATWNPVLAARVGGAIAEEARADGASVLLAPTVNIVRTPRWGRNFETYSEDPYLTAQIALGYVGGVQREGIGVSLKHFAANNQETNRFFVDVRVSERALRELYFPAFEAVVKQADPWSVMASYNKVNGTYVSQNRLLLTDVLKKDWGFPGAVVSDWGATHSTVPAANAGLDLEMPGPPAQFGAKLRKAVDAGEVSSAQIDDNARRVLRMILRSGVLDRAPSAAAPARNHADVARDAAEEAIVLLKNQAVLPLGSDIRTLAVIGPNAASARMQGGGSSEVVPFDAIATPLDALRAAYPGVRITYAQGVDNEETPPAADAALFSPDAGHAEQGLQASYFTAADFAGGPVRSAMETRFIKRISGNIASASVIGYAAIRWEGWLWPRRSGRHELSIRGTGSATLLLDGKTILDKSVKGVPDARDVIGFPVLRRTVALDLEAGRGYRIRLDYATGQTPYEALAFGLREPAPSLDEAVAAARAADAAIVFVGSSSTTEGEGYDRPTLALPGEQDRLVAAVAAANPRTVVVVNSGAAVTMPWRDQVPAILQLWFPGQEGAQALAGILAGRVNPSGKLPVTFPASDADDRADLSTIRSDYSEDLLVGYRRFDAAGAAPLFAFGHGLSYSRFGYSALKAPRRLKGGAALKVRFLLRSEAGPAGKEVVQLYVAPTERGEGEPVRQLRAFAKVALAPGKQRMVTLTIEPRAFATWDEAGHRWRVRPGSYALQVGSGSDDVRLRGEVVVAGGDAFVP